MRWRGILETSALKFSKSRRVLEGFYRWLSERRLRNRPGISRNPQALQNNRCTAAEYVCAHRSCRNLSI